MLTNGSAPYWAGSQLCPRPMGVRLLVSWQSGVPAPRRSGFVWVLGGGPGCRGPGGASLAGEGAGSPARREVRGSAWSAGPGPAPFSALDGPQPLWKPTRLGWLGHPAPRPGWSRPTPTPVASPLTPTPCLVSLKSAPTHPKPTSRGKLGPGVRVLRSRGSRSHPPSRSRSLWATFV